jgi:hypothetical protein
MFNGTSNAWTSIRALAIGRVRSRQILRCSSAIRSKVHRVHVASVCERVASMLRTRLHATSNIRSLSSLLHTCCDYIATMLRPMLLATSNIRSPTSHVCNIKIQHPQHWNLIFATSNIKCAPPPSTQHLTSHICNIGPWCLESTWDFATFKTTSATLKKQHPQHSKKQHLKHPKTHLQRPAILKHLDLLSTSARNTWNILHKHLKHIEHSLATWEKHASWLHSRLLQAGSRLNRGRWLTTFG